MRDLEDLFSLKERLFIVTGGAGLLGSVFVEALIKAGALVAVMDADQDAIDKLKSRLVKSQQFLKTICCDICNPAQVNIAIKDIEEFGQIYGLVNSAAVDPKVAAGGIIGESPQDSSDFGTYSVDSWRKSLEVNLTGAFIVTQAVCRVLEKNKEPHGSIVNISSTYGVIGPDQRIYPDVAGERQTKPLDYSVTKAGLLGFTKALAAYYRDTKLRVNALTPGGAFDNQDALFVENYAARTILGRMAQPNEYAGAIIFLCSDASSYMTGSNLIVDGGWTAL